MKLPQRSTPICATTIGMVSYTQGNGRWGDGEGYCDVDCQGKTWRVAQGDRDCSSSVIECWQEALRGSGYEGALDSATYTGNMRSVFVGSGLFEWKPMSFIAQRGDIYLNERDHTAMCQTPSPDMLSEFVLNEFGGITGGQVGDQTGGESRVRGYYDFPWNGILHYNGKADDDDMQLSDMLVNDGRKIMHGSTYPTVCNILWWTEQNAERTYDYVQQLNTLWARDTDANDTATWGELGEGTGELYLNNWNALRMAYKNTAALRVQVEEIAAKVERIECGNVDYNKLADMVADKLAERLRD